MPDDVATPENDTDLASELEAAIAADDAESGTSVEPVTTEPQETPATPEPEAAKPEAPATPATPAAPAAPAVPAPADPEAGPDVTKLLYDLARTKHGLDLEQAGYKSADEILADLIRQNDELARAEDIRRRYERFAPYESEFSEFIEQRRRPQQPQPQAPQEPQGFRVPQKPDPSRFYEFYERRQYEAPDGQVREKWVPKPECPAAYREQYEAWSEWDARNRQRLAERPDEYIAEMGFVRKDDVLNEVRTILEQERRSRAAWDEANQIIANMPPEYLMQDQSGRASLSPRGLMYEKYVNHYDNLYRSRGWVVTPKEIGDLARQAEAAQFFMNQMQPAQPQAPVAPVPQPVAQQPQPQAPAVPQPTGNPASPAVAKTPNRRSVTQTPSAMPAEGMTLGELADADGVADELNALFG